MDGVDGEEPTAAILITSRDKNTGSVFRLVRLKKRHQRTIIGTTESGL